MTGVGPPEASLVFCGQDVAYATSGTFTGSAFQFIRTPAGTCRVDSNQWEDCAKSVGLVPRATETQRHRKQFG